MAISTYFLQLVISHFSMQYSCILFSSPFASQRKKTEQPLGIAFLRFLTLIATDKLLISKHKLVGTVASSEANLQMTLLPQRAEKRAGSLPLQLHADANICFSLPQVPVTSNHRLRGITSDAKQVLNTISSEWERGT